jgi:hypothetical protein
METGILKEVIAVIRAEQQRRASLLTDEDPNFAYDHWLFKDEPFVNELCLTSLGPGLAFIRGTGRSSK